MTVTPTAERAKSQWTIKSVLEWATADFKQRHIESAWLDAQLLLSHALNLSRIQLITEATRPLSQEELASYRELIKRRRTGEPIAYILGVREFYGLNFKVTPAVLIPRPDSECLVEMALSRTARRDMFGVALDLCTGSGCVAIAMAKQRPTWKFIASDISQPALEIAHENALRAGVAFALGFVQGDLFDAVPRRHFDLITANPPYIPAAEMNNLSVDIRDFEPHLALHGGQDGLLVTRRIIELAPDFLNPGGILALEVGFDQSGEASGALSERGFQDIECARDYGGHARVVSGRWPAEDSAHSLPSAKAGLD